MEAQAEKPSEDTPKPTPVPAAKPAAPQSKSAFVPNAAILKPAQASADSSGARAQIYGQYGLQKRADGVDAAHQEIVLIQFEGLSTMDDQVSVPRDSRAWILTSGMQEPKALAAGIWRVGNLPIRGRSVQTQGTSEGKRVYNYGIICRASLLPITATFVLPDTQSFIERASDMESQEYSALCETQLRTMDGFLGAARFQITFRCEEAHKLIQAFGESKISKGEVLDGEATRTSTKVGILKRIGNWFTGAPSPEPDFFTAIPPFTIADLYRIIRLELMGAVRSTVMKYNAASCNDMAAIRQEVEDQIREHLKSTLNNFGILIDGVSAFQFTCPAYEEYLKHKAVGEITKKETEVAQLHADAQEAMLNLQKQAAKSQVSAEHEVERLKIEEEGKTSKEREAMLKVQQADRLIRNEVDQNHRRSQQKADEDQRRTLQEEKLNMFLRVNEKALEQQNKQADEELRRAKAMLAEYKSVSPEERIALAMIHHPHMVEAYRAVLESRSKDDQIKLLKEFETRITKVQDTRNEQSSEISIEIVRQIGAAFQARLGNSHTDKTRARSKPDIVDAEVKPEPAVEPESSSH